MLKKEFVRRKVRLIHRDLGRLEGFGKYDFSEIAADYSKDLTVKKLLEMIIGRAIDINQHIISELGKGNEKVFGYQDTFSVLADFKVYPKEFASEIAPSVGLRNRIVHEYNDTKDEIIYASVKDAISQYTKYCDFVLKFIDSTSKS